MPFGTSDNDLATADSDVDQVQEAPTPTHIRRRMLELLALGAVIAVVVLTGPGLGELRSRIDHARPGWLLVGCGLEVLSTLCYVVIFRSVFCPRMTWRLSYQIGMSEQAANSVLSVSGAGGLALGVWALRRGGMSAEQIGRKTVAFFFLTSFANIVAVIVLAALYAARVFHPDRNVPLTYGFGAGALAATALVLALPALVGDAKTADSEAAHPGRIARAVRFARGSLVQGLRDATLLLRRRSPGVLIGSFGTMLFDMAVLWACFRAFRAAPPLGVLGLGYLIGQLGGNLPIPGGIGGLDAGLIGTFALYHQPLAATTAAVLVYHAISLWVPALLGSVAFVQLRRTLERSDRPAAICFPLAEPIEVVPSPSRLAAPR
jgi:uncharacterized membrane protein YbhN (UPF0104 family)